MQRQTAFAAAHPLLVQMLAITVCVAVFFVAGYGAARWWLDALMQKLRKLDANEAVSGSVLGLVLLYAISAEWLGSVAGITGAYLLGYVFAGSQYKADVERSFQAMFRGSPALVARAFTSDGRESVPSAPRAMKVCCMAERFSSLRSRSRLALIDP